MLVETGADHLLWWASEQGGGSWSQWTDAVTEVWPGADQAWRSATMSSAARLGHVEMDWTARRWTTCSPVLATAPSSPVAFLCGARGQATMQRLAAVYDGADGAPPAWVQPTDTDHSAPRTLYVQADSFGQLQAIADFIDASLVHEPSVGLARVLPNLDDLLADSRQALPVPESTVDRYLPRTGGWERAGVGQPGLYRFRPEFGPTEFRYKDQSGKLLAVDRAVGMYAALRDARVRVLGWAEQDVNGEMAVREDAFLPDLHARVGALCSGMLGRRWHFDGAPHIRYANVPLDVYRAVATSLGQPFREVKD